VRLAAFKVRNYKSFDSATGVEGDLSSGVNIIVGQNNSGKTALLEVVTLRAGNVPHRSLQTHPTPHAVTDQFLNMFVDVALSLDELREFIADYAGGHFTLRAPGGSHSEARQFLQRAATPELIIRVSRRAGANPQGDVRNYVGGDGLAHFDVRRPDLQLAQADGGNTADLGQVVASAIHQRIYLFGAERFRVGEGPFGHQAELAPDARNLPEVLNRLQSNRDLLAHFNMLVRRVLPQVLWVSVEPVDASKMRILIWNIDPRHRRPDLAVPLNQSGTGVGQVLAILYVAALSQQPQIIAIDEPQSFLHPGAVRALIEILHEHSQHQFLITTHSPVALTAAHPDRILYLRTDEGVSSVSQLNALDASDLKVLLADLGVRVEDVFGYDTILWVEGRTEEVCVPLILKRLLGRPLARIGVFGLIATGDLDGRHRDLAFDVYNKLSQGSVLMPPAVAFVFDRERRRDARTNEMIARGEGKVAFLPRRMFENYLIEPDAIEAVARSIDGFGPITSADVSEWLRRHQWEPELFSPGPPPPNRTNESWLEHVSGAKVLDRIFAELSETRVTYDKVKHGQALTAWLLDRLPETLRPLAEFLSRRLPVV
jgi:energy-coupling factor transporter ATP-binding protein EcfA2